MQLPTFVRFKKEPNCLLKKASMKKVIKIDLEKEDEVQLLNPSEIARRLGVTPQYAGRVLSKKQPGTKLKERIISLFGIDKHQVT